MIVVKIGGSLATVKERPFTPRLGWLRLVSERIAARRPLAVVLGGGGYGHQAVATSRDAGATAAELAAVVSAAMMELALLVTDVLLSAGLRAVVYPPHALCRPRGLKPNCRWEVVRDAISAGVTPVLYGDVYPSPEAPIISGDELAVEAACALGASRLVFLSDVDGVLDERGRPIPFLDRAGLERLLGSGAVGTAGTPDVTGGMRRKLEALLRCGCAGLEAVIVNGRRLDAVERALAGGAVGTVIRL